MSVSRIKNLKSGPLVLNNGFAEPVTLQSGQEINISTEVLLNAEIQRLVQAKVLSVMSAKELVVNEKPKVEKHIQQEDVVVTATSKETVVKEKVTKAKSAKVEKTPKAPKNKKTKKTD